MPSPIGHALAGLTVHALTARDTDELREPWRATVLVAAAVAPDLDLLIRFVDGRNHHQCESHSVGFAVVAALALAVGARALGRVRPVALGLAAGGAWLSHVVLDYLSLDTSVPIGIMALWPASRDHYSSPAPFFLDIGRTLEWVTVWHDARAVAWEVATLLPLLVLTWRLRRRAIG